MMQWQKGSDKVGLPVYGRVAAQVAAEYAVSGNFITAGVEGSGCSRILCRSPPNHHPAPIYQSVAPRSARSIPNAGTASTIWGALVCGTELNPKSRTVVPTTEMLSGMD